MEDYVAEEIAARMLEEKPGLRAEFEQKLASDPAFAGDASARLQFFYRRSPWWDERKDVYPIVRIEKGPSPVGP